MDSLEGILQSATDDEIAAFKSELAASTKKKRELELLNYHTSGTEWTDDALMRVIYEPPNSDAYHSLRKRLLRDLSDFLAKRKFAEEQYGYIPLIRLLSNADTMLERNNPESAMYFFNKAEKKAIQQHKYIILHALYSVQLSNANVLGLDQVRLEMLLQQNLQQLKIVGELNSVYSKIIKEFAEQKKVAGKPNVQLIFSTVFHNDELMRTAQNDAEFMFKIAVLVRSVVVVAKEYSEFLLYILKVYHHLLSKNAFYDGPAGLQIRFLYMIAQSYYRNWNFQEVKLMLPQIDACLPKHHPDRHPIYPKMVMMNAAIHLYGNNPLEAIGIYNRTLEQFGTRLPQTVVLDMFFNLSVFYFCIEDYKQANQTMLRIHHGAAWLDHHKGKEWRMKMELVLVIFQYELRNPDVAESRIVSIRGSFEKLLKEPNFERVNKFMSLIIRLINHPEIAWTEEFAHEVSAAGLQSPTETEDIQAVTFYCWLLSKMQRRKFYEVLMEWVRNNG